MAHTYSIYISEILYVHVIVSAAAVVLAAEGHREGPHTLEQQRGHAVTQVKCNSLFLAAQCGTHVYGMLYSLSYS